MAKGTLTTTTEMVEVEVETVTLTLTKEEATTLGAILFRVGGLPSGYRGDAEEVLDALADTLGGGARGSFEVRGRSVIGNSLNPDVSGTTRGAIYFGPDRD